MKPKNKIIAELIFINIILMGIGFLLVSKFNIPVLKSDITILSSGFCMISIFSLLIFIRGQAREPESQTFHSLVSVGLKFLLELVLALLWFIVAKKSSFPSLILFFVLYLSFTLFLLYVMVKTLKTKSL